MKSKILNELIKPVGMKKLYSLPEDELLLHIRKEWRIDDVPDFLYSSFNVTKTIFEGRPVFKIEPKANKTEKVIFFVHGGGGMLCPTVFHFLTAARLVRGTKATMYFPFYPLAPEYNLAIASKWLDGVYADITHKHPPSKITVIGDSAGAALGAGVCERSDKKPNGVILISPGTGIENSDDEKLIEQEKKDKILSRRMLKIIDKYWGCGISPDSGMYNAAYADFSGFPPIQLYYCANEIFYPYIGTLIDRINKYGIPLEIFKEEGLFHDWAIVPVIPEGRRAVKNMCGFINSYESGGNA